MTNYIVRKGVAEDINAVFMLVQELARYENALAEIMNTPEQLLKDGFGERAYFEFFIAETVDKEAVGMILYYYSYSTWKGKSLYIDDLVVKETHRRQGIGTLLFNALIAEAALQQVGKLHWQVLDWNEPAIRFYKQLGATLDPEWVNCKLSKTQLQTYLSN
ncbi:acetyltransferase, ribosomal protein N-acetylase [Beggiatoa alba B18LD]|uniref:Acetyltransferase, ribosomal protein N-acetylase n=1 Tax=Beggiatoa alba B18LD TaxID=395493 RepID=I3CC07_9GAMM|nr:GNAT family N-acetyltransferase [Beggiatoa alba]EIJ41150.1 acetyltransferase, ribosomal protein N-acetylase [Beggiatoa alba B18LD]